MKKKILLSLAAGGTALALLPLLAAFEAHVINVTAKIENALSVPLEHIRFGTVFPQEYLEKELPIRLSKSFLDEPRVDDVEYFIRQKPKCVITSHDGTEYNENDPTATGHIILGDNPATTGVVEEYWYDCGPEPRVLQQDNTATPENEAEVWGVLPSLCPYLSKHERSEDGSETNHDGSLPSFHTPWEIVVNDNGTPLNPLDDFKEIKWTDVKGRLTKLHGDMDDNWIIDLAVPCFGGYCAQDWESFVKKHNPNANPNEFTQPIANEHKIFGCDLWVEVKGVSEMPIAG